MVHVKKMAQAMIDVQKGMRKIVYSGSDSGSDLSAPSSFDDDSDEDPSEGEVCPQIHQHLNTDMPGTVFIRFSYTDLSFVKEIQAKYAFHFPLELPVDRLSIKPTEAEKIAKKKAYRKEYRTRDYVIKKAEEEKKDPERVQKRKEYSKRPEVKARKREIAKAKRKFLKACKENPNSDYRLFVGSLVPPVSKKRKRVDETPVDENKEER